MAGFRRSSELAMNGLRFFDAIGRGEKWATRALWLWIAVAAILLPLAIYLKNH